MGFLRLNLALPVGHEDDVMESKDRPTLVGCEREKGKMYNSGLREGRRRYLLMLRIGWYNLVIY